MDLFDLTGTGAVVTGGNSGIGLGMALALAKAGAAVAIWGTNEEKNAAALKELQASGGAAADRCVALRCDVGDEQQVVASFAASVEKLGRVDSCFANAGINGMAPITEMSLEEFRRVTRVNLDGAFTTLREAAAHMVQRGEGGSLVVTSSLSALEGAARFEHYAATKAGVLALIRGMAVELARHRIRANGIVPGWIETAMTEPMIGWDAFSSKVLPRIPARRWGQPSDFGGIAVYLASGASEYHTGDTFVIDGGYSIF